MARAGATGDRGRAPRSAILGGDTIPRRARFVLCALTLALAALPARATAALAGTSSNTRPARCAPNLAEQLRRTGGARELVLVDAPVAATTDATMTLWRKRAGCFILAGGPWAARIGVDGFSDHHREGVPSTPTGAYGIGTVMYGNAPNPGVHYTYRRLACGDWWDADPRSPWYNTFQQLPCGRTPSFGGDSEALWRETRAYPSFAVIEYNSAPARPGAGSGIFIHADTGGPTAGCVSVPLDELDALLRWLQPADRPLVVLGPRAAITGF